MNCNNENCQCDKEKKSKFHQIIHDEHGNISTTKIINMCFFSLTILSWVSLLASFLAMCFSNFTIDHNYVQIFTTFIIGMSTISYISYYFGKKLRKSEVNTVEELKTKVVEVATKAYEKVSKKDKNLGDEENLGD